MADQTDEHQTDNNNKELTDNDNDSQNNTSAVSSDEYQEIIDRVVEERLQKMKSNVDKAYKKAEELARENTRLKEQQQEAKRKQLEDEGKHLEAANLRLSEFEEKNAILTEKLTSLTRDRELDKHLSGLEFRNEFAKETAFKTIVSELVQDNDGMWVHKSGAPIGDYIKSFVKDPDKDFLFKPKDNSGTGTSAKNQSSANAGRPKSLSGLSTEEMLKLAAEGKLGSVQY